MKPALYLLSATLLILTIYSCRKSDPVRVKPVAVAPADVTITLPVNSVVLKGSGTDQSGNITGYLWSQVYGPNEAGFLNEASASVTVNGLIVGKYLFQLAVTDNYGLTGIDTVAVYVKASQVQTTQTLTLSPANNPTEVALAILGTTDATNTLSVEEPNSAWTINGVSFTVRDLIKFDLGSIPSNASVITADLYFYSDPAPINGDLIHANYGTDNSLLVQQVNQDWAPATLNWFNQPTITTANQAIVPSTSLPFLDVDVNVKDMVGAMISSGKNYGFKIQLQNEVIYTSRIFCSSYATDATKHPRLIIQYKTN